ncbi:hypothetical protein [Campylobacter troglodytis]|uniref:hypothetical protein n=1 Tax=Campylobacter troglodytis TaxID=654363 RepID=UPI001156D75E|nr:hypothetical protein [Campylobacter troglodytis]
MKSAYDNVAQGENIKENSKNSKIKNSYAKFTHSLNIHPTDCKPCEANHLSTADDFKLSY